MGSIPAGDACFLNTEEEQGDRALSPGRAFSFRLCVKKSCPHTQCLLAITSYMATMSVTARFQKLLE